MHPRSLFSLAEHLERLSKDGDPLEVLAGSMVMIGGRGDRQFPADRLDTQILAVRVDKRHHHLPWRSSSA